MTAKRGPKTEPNVGDLQRLTVLVDDVALTRLRVLGDGNLSAGVRRAARDAYDVYQRTPDQPAVPTNA